MNSFTFLAPGNRMGMNLKFLLPFWMNSLWSWETRTRSSETWPLNSAAADTQVSEDADLFVNINRVEGPVILLQLKRGGRHRLIVLGTDDDDDQVLLLGEQVTWVLVNSCFTRFPDSCFQLLRQVSSCTKPKDLRAMQQFVEVLRFFFICKLLFKKVKFCRSDWSYLAEVPLHEVNLANTSELLLKNVNLKRCKHM